MKALKIVGIVILVPVALLAVLLIASTINHGSQLRKEAQETAPGTMVEVNGTALHVHLEGEGDLTLVFLSGHGTTHPALDFKPLWMRMVDDYRIAVVERPGYGWSETSRRPRDIDTVLEETRQALELAGETGPYVLVPHSMAGLEALYWAQTYPDEVKAIVGLDPATPEVYEILPEPQKAQLVAMYLVSRIGLSRSMPEADVGAYLPLMVSEDLTEADKREYLAVFYRNAYSRDMLREVDYLKANAATVAENGVPADTPMLFFISDGQEASAPGWGDALSEYVAQVTVGESVPLAAGHYVHYEQAEVIAEAAKAFLEEVK